MDKYISMDMDDIFNGGGVYRLPNEFGDYIEIGGLGGYPEFGSSSSNKTKAVNNTIKKAASKDLLSAIMMKKYGITPEDLENIDIVKSKLRDGNIDDILS